MNIIPGLLTSDGDAGDFGDVNDDDDVSEVLRVFGVCNDELVECNELDVRDDDVEDGVC